MLLYLKVHCPLIEYENRKVKPAHYLVQIIDYNDPYDQHQEWFAGRGGIVIDPTLARAIGFYNIYHQTWALIEQGKTIMHCGSTTFAYDNEFKRTYEGGGSSLRRYLWLSLWCWSWKVLSKKGKKYFLELFEKWDREHLQLDEDFDDYPNNDGVEDIIGDEGMQNLNNDD